MTPSGACARMRERHPHGSGGPGGMGRAPVLPVARGRPPIPAADGPRPRHRAAARVPACPWRSPARVAWFVEVSGRPRRRQRPGPSSIAASIGVTSLRPARPDGSRVDGRVDVDDLRCAPRTGARWEVRASPCPAADRAGSPPATSRATALRLVTGARPVGSRCPRGGAAGVGASRWLLASHGSSVQATDVERCPGAHARCIDLGPRGRIRQGGSGDSPRMATCGADRPGCSPRGA